MIVLIIRGIDKKKMDFKTLVSAASFLSTDFIKRKLLAIQYGGVKYIKIHNV